MGVMKGVLGSGVNTLNPLGSHESCLHLKVKTISATLCSVTSNFHSDEADDEGKEEEDILTSVSASV